MSQLRIKFKKFILVIRNILYLLNTCIILLDKVTEQYIIKKHRKTVYVL